MSVEARIMRDEPDIIIPKGLAIVNGLKVYRDGKPSCPKGHLGFRWISNDKCLECGHEQEARGKI